MKKIFLLFCAAAGWLGAQAQTEALELPFYETFPDTVDVDAEDAQWTVLDNNGDGYQYEWGEYLSASFDPETGCASLQGSQTLASDDYLATKPIRMEQGTAHISFYFTGGYSDDLKETMDVLFGASDVELTALPVVLTLERMGQTEWTLAHADVEVPADGTYRFAFHGKTAAGGSQIRIDEVRIDAGAYEAKSELVAVYPLLPLSGCALTDADSIGLVVRNMGTKAAEGFTASYAIDGGAWVSEDFTATVNPGDSATVWFTTKADFSTANTIYSVHMQAASADQLYQFNDTCSSVVRNVAAATVPYAVSFDTIDAGSVELFWWPSDPLGRGWFLDNGSYRPYALDVVPLASGCFDLEQGYYRLVLSLEAGSWGSPENYTSDFFVLMGESGTPLAAWDTLAYERKLYTEYAVIDWSTNLRVAEGGTYSFAIVSPRGQGYVALYGVRLEAMQAHDVAIVATEPSAFPRLIPADQLADNTLKVLVENRGTEAEQVVLTALQDEKEIAKSESFAVPAGETVEQSLVLSYKHVAPDAVVDLTIQAGLEAEDAIPADNVVAHQFTATAAEAAYDNLTAFDRTAGAENSGVGLGHVFYMGDTDTLTAMKIGFGAVEAAIPFKLNVYEVDDTDVTRLLRTMELERAKEAGFQEFPISPMLLEKDKRYFMEVEQVGADYMALAYEPNEKGQYHTKMGWYYAEEFFNPDSLMVQPGSNLGIRPVFASGVEPVAADLEAVAFELPLDTNLMLREEPVRVMFRNLGFEAQQAARFRCLVDGVQADTARVPVRPYDQSLLVGFNVDLSAVGEHELTVYADLPADANRSNDTIRHTVYSMAEADPYRLDFEQCADFATDRMNPVWMSVDKDGGVTGGYGYMGFMATWPGYDKPFGFVAFNPDATVPLFPDFFTGYHGRRFGASFFAMDGNTEIASNDWLISPKLALGEKPELRFRVKSQTDKYGLEEYNVYVSTTDTAETSFTRLGDTRQAPAEWEDVVIDLADYKNQSVHVAIQCVSKGQFIFQIDDIEVVKDAGESAVGAVDARPCVLFVDPASGTLHIHAGETLREVALFDAGGRWLTTVAASADQCTIDVSNLPAGVYACRITTATGRTELGKFAVR